MERSDLARRLAVLERLGVGLLLAAAVVPRVRDLGAGFDREFEGAQGAFFAIAAVNYERFGTTRFRGYPMLLVDTPADAVPTSPLDGLVYANHPPLVPLVAWASVALVGPVGWSDAWTEGRAPEGVETALRLPFLLFHLFGLWALWWTVRTGLGSGAAMIGLALYASLPLACLYGSLVNYENPSLPFGVLAVGLYARWARSGERRDLIGLGLAFGAGCSFTYGPAFFLPPLVLHALARQSPSRAVRVALSGGAGVLIPVALHSMWTPAGASGGVIGRARVLLEPLMDGTAPFGEWCRRQLVGMAESFGPVVLVAAALGLVCLALRGLSPKLDARLAGWQVRGGEARVDVATLLALGGFLYLLAFYRHTLDPQRPFLLYVVPGAVAAAAFAVVQISVPLLRLRSGILPHVAVVTALVVPGLARLEELRWRFRSPGPSDDPAAEHGPGLPLPATSGARLAELLPRGSIGLHPPELGLNLATTFYAWRNLVPFESLEGPPPAIVRASSLLQGADVYVTLPRDAPEPANAAIGAMVSRMSERSAPDLETGHWLAWRSED